LKNQSVKFRFALSAVGNLAQISLAFFSTLIIARVLGPENYGIFGFLAGSLVALKNVLDMGTGSAFYTFISKKSQPISFYILYALWQLIQFIFPFLIIAFILPQSWLETIWMGHERGLIILAFSAIFFQHLVWPTMSCIGDAKRMTKQVQILNVSISVFNLCLVSCASILEVLTVSFLFWVLLIQYLLASIISLNFFSVFKIQKGSLNVSRMLSDYYFYCLPLFLSTLVSFVFEFSDRWLLQSFGGSEEQAFYIVGYKFTAVGILATTSILKIFWKEIAEAYECQNSERIRVLYKRTSRFLYLITAIICGFMIPWSEQIILVTLGPSYSAGAAAISAMFLFSLHASLGQVNGVFLKSTNETKFLSVASIIFMGISIPISYFIQAPQNAWIPGFNLGALGMAWKMIVLNGIFVNSVSWWISKKHGWEFEWAYQVVGLVVALLLGWISYELIMVLNSILLINIYLQIGLALIIYGVTIPVAIWFLPWLTGYSQGDIRVLLLKATGFFSK
jgi:O-antigen/teichoic acid export membrane protein